MSQAKFNQIFLALMVLALALSLVVPLGFSNLFRGLVNSLILPVAGPVRYVGTSLRYRVSPDSDTRGAASHASEKGRGAAELRAEVERLRAENSRLGTQMTYLREQLGLREKLGDAGKYCRPFEVLFPDARDRESLSLRATVADGIAADMAVLTPDNLIGRVMAVGVGGAQVRLITDPKFVVRVAFRRYEADPKATAPAFTAVKVEEKPVTCYGAGRGLCVVSLPKDDAGVLRDGDWVVLDDGDWPQELQGMPLGRVERVGPRPQSPGWSDVTVRPRVNAGQLTSAMVMLRKPGEK